MKMFALFGLLTSFIFLALAFLGIWTYRDAKNRGLDAGMWTAIVVLVPNLIGLIIYFLVGRNEEMVECNSCNRKVQKSSKYCMNCGNEMKMSTEYNMEKVERPTKGLMIGFIVFFIAMILTFAVFAFMVFKDGDLESNSGISIGLMETNIGDKWNVSYISSNKVFYHTITIKDNNPKTLYIETECGEGELSLRLEQDKIEKTMDLSESTGVYEFDLSLFNDGKVKLYLSGNDAKNVKFKAYWE